MSAKFSSKGILREAVAATKGRVNFVPPVGLAYEFAQLSPETATTCWIPSVGPQPALALMKALAARDCAIPFYVAAPSTSIDWSLQDGRDIPIEERSAEEVTHVTGRASSGQAEQVQIFPDGTAVKNFAFDVTPPKFVTGLITERGVCQASREGLLGLFPERDWRLKTAGVGG